MEETGRLEEREKNLVLVRLVGRFQGLVRCYCGHYHSALYALLYALI